MPKLTLMEEVLLLGLKDKQVSLLSSVAFFVRHGGAARVPGDDSGCEGSDGVGIMSWEGATVGGRPRERDGERRC